MIKATRLAIPDVVLIEPIVYKDERGYFFESYNQKDFEAAIGRKVSFVQDNHSRSRKNVLRGLHYQTHHPQGKLVRVVSGEVFDVAVDIRKGSPTFGKWVSQTLSALNKRQLWIPEGFAHGYLVTSESAEVLYKATDYYVPNDAKCIHWHASDLAIDWPLDTNNPILSPMDQTGVPTCSSVLPSELDSY